MSAEEELEPTDIDVDEMLRLRARWDDIRTTFACPHAEPLSDVQRLALDLPTVGLGFWFLRLVDDITEYSSRANTQLAYENGECPAGGILDLVHPLDLAQVIDALEQKLMGIWPFDVECRLMTRLGTYRWCRVAADTERSPDQRVRYLVGSLEDITARRSLRARLQETNARLTAEIRERERVELDLRLAQKLEAVGQLTSGIATEMKVPLAGARAHLGVVRRCFEQLVSMLDDGSSRNDLEGPTRQIDAALSSTTDDVERVGEILDALRVFSDGGGPTHRHADLNLAVQRTLVLVRSNFGVIAEVETALDEALALTPCDVAEIAQALAILLANAARAVEADVTGRETGKIWVTTRQEPGMAVVEVADNGCGITSKAASRIWESGFGRSLAMARSIVVERHQGELGFERRPGGGTVFRLCLPNRGEPARMTG